mgnify:CR=1 FL=1
MKKQAFIYFFLFLLGSFVMAQDFLSWQMNDRYFTAQAGFGFASYRGELKHNGSIQNEISNISLGVEARLLPKVGARIEIGRYSIRGHDRHAPDSSYAQQRNLSFSSTNYEISVQGIFYMKKYAGAYYKRHKVDPYLLAGVGATFISPTAELAGQQYNLYDLQTEDTEYSRFTMIFPVGAGLKWKINPFLNFTTEITYRFTLSDYLDDVSGNYPQNPGPGADLLSNRKDEVGVINQEAYDQLVAGAPRGDQQDKDAYLFLNLKFEFFLPPGLFKGK